jgi:hypothetical protein
MRTLLATACLFAGLTLAVGGIAGAVVMISALAAFAAIFLPIAGIAALAGTAYWVLQARRGPDWDRELMGLIALFVILADVAIIYFAIYTAITDFAP